MDFDRYPIADPDAPDAQALVARGRRELDDNGCLVLAGFIRPEAVATMAAQGETLLGDGFHNCFNRNREIARSSLCFAWKRDTRVAMTSVGGDRIGDETLLRQLYDWDPMTDFIGALLGRDPYYRSADPLAGLMVTSQDIGDELGWHYDGNDGVVTLNLQRASTGGRFEYVRNCRPGNMEPDIQHDAIDAVMDGEHPELRVIDQEPGTLVLFNGYRSLHRVSPVEAGPRRMMALLSYDARPDFWFRPDIRIDYFGRDA
ncbi:MAG: 2OG-Fe(II) oxygenase [Alphaproteobacteria bacterium]|nr:2OG-Fe(II) oxygenase [Rhodospirillaceae bacterium]MDG2482585.1 2OG-Fe(II) oxygenase [Alphaproteobacteria bacterium]MBT6205633.1 2OG-Fe(II) oxygenase [Rhodospirillaceae bacterium]MBT6510083.1 2OG-Fe(II) oxygenase [Rhodospirillaceae bacterium]MBT7611807.1 2OG-Fe(II) oxygenase [Rhodospirillaceae bacterium]